MRDELGQSTSEVRKGHEFSVSKLSDYLSSQISDFHGPIVVRQFNVGQSNPTFLVEDSRGRKLVVRKKPSGKLIATAHMIEREYRIIKALKTVGYPVPQVYLLCENSDILGTPFYVMEFLSGRIFTDVTLAELSPAHRRECYFEVVRTLAKLHQIDYKKIGLGDFGKEGGFYERQIHRMATTSRAQEIPGKVEPLPHIDDLLKWFPSNLPNDVSTIVHGDFKFDNLIFHGSENRIIGVLDWEMSTIGHPLSDVANLSLPFVFPVDFPPPITGLGGFDKDYGIPSEDEFIGEYCKLLKQPFPIKSWKFCVAFSLFRMAVILQGIASRAAKGQASNPMAELIGEIAGPLSELSWTKITEQKSNL